jgi:hypothetical protein
MPNHDKYSMNKVKVGVESSSKQVCNLPERLHSSGHSSQRFFFNTHMALILHFKRQLISLYSAIIATTASGLFLLLHPADTSIKYESNNFEID